MIGERIDVGYVGIGDIYVGEAGVGAHVLRLADWDRHHGGAVVAADLDGALHRTGIGGHAQHRRQQHDGQGNRDIAEPAAGTPARTPPRKTDATLVTIHGTPPTTNMNITYTAD